MEHRARLVATVVAGVPHAWLRVPINGDWVAEHRLAIQKGRVVVAAVRVYPRAWLEGLVNPEKTPVSEERAGLRATVPPGGLRRTVLRRVKVGALTDAYAEVLGGLAGHALSRALQGPVFDETGRKILDALPGDPARLLSPLDELTASLWGARPGTRPRAPDAKRAGRRPLGDDVLVEAADAYARAWKQGDRRPRMRELAKTLKMSEARMRDLVYRARRRVFLPPTTQGRGGGTLTREARMLLRKLRRRSARGGRRR
jgi:hypothetical protein